MHEECRKCGGKCCQVHLINPTGMTHGQFIHLLLSGVLSGEHIAWVRRCAWQEADGRCKRYAARPEPCEQMVVGGRMCRLAQEAWKKLREGGR